MPNTKPPMHPSVERIVTQGRLNKHAMVIATPTGHRFASYSTGIQRYERVCVELDAVLEEPGPRTVAWRKVSVDSRRG